MAPTSPPPRSQSRPSYLPTSTYHSVQNNELPELAPHPETTGSSTATGLNTQGTRRLRPSWRDEVEKRPPTFQMVRQDSGYESGPSLARSSSSSKRQRKHTKNSSSTSSDCAHQRPGLRRTSGSSPVARMPRSSLTGNRPSFLTPQQQSNLERKNSYFQFPAPENLDPQEDDGQSGTRPSVDLAPVILKVNTANLNQQHEADSSSSSLPDPSSTKQRSGAWANSPFAVPPPTTHYWTSDQTRQLEYAAIDAASKGVRGWIMRKVPDCLVPRNHRRAGFEDDGGSVRRYRIELEVECPEDSVPPSPVGETPRGFRARGAKRTWWAKLRGCT